jgi:group I intron endonuclease
MIGIYKITSPSGKVYIGQSRCIEKRLSGYKKYGAKFQLHLQYSFIKHGANNHSFAIVHELPQDVTQDVLNRYEQIYIDSYRDCGAELMNIREGGTTGALSKESRTKLSEATKKQMSEMTVHEARQRAEKISNSMKGKSTIWLTGRKLSQESIAKRLESTKGIRRSDESKKRYSESKKGDKNPAFGKRPVNARLTKEQVFEIRNTPIVRSYGHYAALGRKFGVKSCTISAIVQNRIWRNEC